MRRILVPQNGARSATFLTLTATLLTACLSPNTDKKGDGATTDSVRVVGRVVSGSGAPLAGMAVRLARAGLVDTTDVLGRYRLEGEPGRSGLAKGGRSTGIAADEDTLHFEQGGQPVLSLGVSWVDSLPDVSIVQRGVSGALSVVGMPVSRVVGVLWGEGISEASPHVVEFFHNRLVNEVTGFMYFPPSPPIRQYQVYLAAHDTAGRLVGRSQTLAFNSLAGNLTLPSFRADNALPRAFAGEDTILKFGDTLRLRGAIVDSFGGTASKWEWDVGGTGIFAQTSSADTLISLPAFPVSPYRCILRVTDNDGNLALDTLLVEVSLDKPVPAIVGSGSVKVGATLNLSAQATQRFGSIVMYKWNDGMGGSGWTDSSATLSQKAYRYTAKGEYMVRLYVRDDDGNADSVMRSISVTNDNPVVSGLKDTSVSPGSTVMLFANATDPEGIRGYLWDIGDDGIIEDSSTTGSLELSVSSYPTAIRVAVTVRDSFDGEARVAATILALGKLTAQPSSHGFRHVAAGSSGQLIALDYFGSVFTSVNGVDWTSRGVEAGQYGGAVVWAGTQWVGLNSGTGQALTSGDGVTWSSHPFGGNDTMMAIVWTGSQLVAVGDFGRIRTSPDGATWTARSSGMAATFGNSLNAVASNDDLLVAVGVGGMIRTSPDGVAWTAQTSGTTRNLNTVIWSGTHWVAAGSGGGGSGNVVLTSPDGVAWTSRNFGTSSALFSIVRAGDLLILCGDGGAIRYAGLDGATWNPLPYSVSSADFKSAAWTGSRLVIVGNSLTVSTP